MYKTKNIICLLAISVILIITIILYTEPIYSQNQTENLATNRRGNSTLDFANTLGNGSSTGNSTLDFANTLGNGSSTGNSTLDFTGINITNFTVDPILNRNISEALISNYDYTNVCTTEPSSRNCVFWGDQTATIPANYHNQGGDISNLGYSVIGWIDNPRGDNAISYSIDYSGGYSYPPVNAAPGKWIGGQSQGLGIALGQVNYRPTDRQTDRSDLIVSWIDNPARDNHAYYYVGFDNSYDTNGNMLGGWSDIKQIAPGKWIGWESQDAGLAITNLDGDRRPEVVFSWIDNPPRENHAYYYVGFDMDENGNVGNWSDVKQIDPEKGIGWESEAAGIAVVDLNNNRMPDLTFYHVDNPEEHNYAYYRIGYDLDANGNIVNGWSRIAQIPGSVGYHTEGGGIAINPFGSSDGLHDFQIMNVDNPEELNHARIRHGEAKPP